MDFISVTCVNMKSDDNNNVLWGGSRGNKYFDLQCNPQYFHHVIDIMQWTWSIDSYSYFMLYIFSNWLLYKKQNNTMSVTCIYSVVNILFYFYTKNIYRVEALSIKKET